MYARAGLFSSEVDSLKSRSRISASNMSEMCEATSPFFLSHSGAQHVLTAALTLFGSTCFFIVVCVVRSSKHNRTLPGSKKKEKTKSGESTAKSDKNGNVQLKFFRKLARSSPPSRHPRDLHAVSGLLSFKNAYLRPLNIIQLLFN